MTHENDATSIQKEIDWLEDESALLIKVKQRDNPVNASMRKSKTGRPANNVKEINRFFSNKAIQSSIRSKSQRLSNGFFIKEFQKEIIVKNIDCYFRKNTQKTKRMSIQKYHHIFEDGIITFNNRFRFSSSIKRKQRYTKR